MSRTIGAYDLVQRKPRSDIGKKRKLYRGQKTKGKRQIVQDRRKGNKEILKLWIWEYLPMSIDGRRRWNKYARPYASPFVCPGDRRLRIDVHVSQIDNKDKIQNLIAETMYPGTFYVMGFSHGKNKVHVKPVKLCKILVTQTNSGNVGRMINNYRLSRYWFWKK